MKKRLSSQNAPGAGAGHQTAPGGAGYRTVPGGTASQADPKTDPRPSAATPRPTDGPAGWENAETPDGTEVVNDVLKLHPDLQALVGKMLKEGSTFEDVVEGVNARGEQRLTLNAVKSYFQGNRVLQTQRARRQVEDAEALLATLDKDPRSAEARLARATFLTGYSRLNRNTSEVTPREAARFRMECENLKLKHQILMMQRKKAEQDLEYSRAKTNLIQITQGKMQGEILRLERELKAHRAGDPIGPEVLKRIQELYGLACQPLVYEESANAAAKA